MDISYKAQKNCKKIGDYFADEEEEEEIKE